jgi:hypothetical protein
MLLICNTLGLILPENILGNSFAFSNIYDPYFFNGSLIGFIKVLDLSVVIPLIDFWSLDYDLLFNGFN